MTMAESLIGCKLQVIEFDQVPYLCYVIGTVQADGPFNEDIIIAILPKQFPESNTRKPWTSNYIYEVIEKYWNKKKGCTLSINKDLVVQILSFTEVVGWEWFSIDSKNFKVVSDDKVSMLCKLNFNYEV